MYPTLVYLIRLLHDYTFSDYSWTQAEEDEQLGFCLCLDLQKGKCWCGIEVGGGV